MNYEIEELEQRIVELEGQNAFECGCVSEYKEKLDIAVKALEEFGNVCNWGNSEYGYVFTKCDPLELAQQVLKEIREL